MVRLGVCCLFVAQPIRFRLTTATYMRKFSRSEQLSRLASLSLSNAGALLQAIEYCGSHDYIDEQDFPAMWRSLDITVEVEAKAKELAVRRLYNSLGASCGDRCQDCGGTDWREIASYKLSQICQGINPAFPCLLKNSG